MSRAMAGYIIGGIVPAVLLGVYSVTQKAATERGISPGMLLVVIGCNVIVVGLVYCWITNDFAASPASGVYASLTGLLWALATCLIAFTMSRFQTPISKLVPLFNTNTLVAVGLGLLCFAEWRNVAVWRLLAGAVLIVAGGALACPGLRHAVVG